MRLIAPTGTHLPPSYAEHSGWVYYIASFQRTLNPACSGPPLRVSRIFRLAYNRELVPEGQQRIYYIPVNTLL